MTDEQLRQEVLTGWALSIKDLVSDWAMSRVIARIRRFTLPDGGRVAWVRPCPRCEGKGTLNPQERREPLKIICNVCHGMGQQVILLAEEK